jgi:hypothetical protein
MSEVEGQELGGLTGHLGRHGHPVGVDGEVHQRSAGQGDVGRIPVASVLADGVLDVLVGEWVLQLSGSRRDAVNQQDHVQGLDESGSKASCRVTLTRFAAYSSCSSGVRPWAGWKNATWIVTPRSTTP